MNALQQEAFRLVARTLEPRSRWYEQDLAITKKHCSEMSNAQAKDTISRMKSRVSATEIARNCQL